MGRSFCDVPLDKLWDYESNPLYICNVKYPDGRVVLIDMAQALILSDLGKGRTISRAESRILRMAPKELYTIRLETGGPGYEAAATELATLCKYDLLRY